MKAQIKILRLFYFESYGFVSKNGFIAINLSIRNQVQIDRSFSIQRNEKPHMKKTDPTRAG